MKTLVTFPLGDQGILGMPYYIWLLILIIIGLAIVLVWSFLNIPGRREIRAKKNISKQFALFTLDDFCKFFKDITNNRYPSEKYPWRHIMSSEALDNGWGIFVSRFQELSKEISFEKTICLLEVIDSLALKHPLQIPEWELLKEIVVDKLHYTISDTSSHSEWEKKYLTQNALPRKKNEIATTFISISEKISCKDSATFLFIMDDMRYFLSYLCEEDRKERTSWHLARAQGFIVKNAKKKEAIDIENQYLQTLLGIRAFLCPSDQGECDRYDQASSTLETSCSSCPRSK